jgi:hypothetical protein
MRFENMSSFRGGRVAPLSHRELTWVNAAVPGFSNLIYPSISERVCIGGPARE